MTIGFRCMAFSALLLLFFSTPTLAQSITAQPNNNYLHSEALSSTFKKWQVYQLDAPALLDAVKSRTTPEILLGTHTWRLDLRSSRIMSPEYSLQVITSTGKQVLRNQEDIAFQGYETNSGGRVRLTLTNNFIYGYVAEGNETYYIEPLWYHEPTAASDLFVVYKSRDVIPNTDATCAVREMKDKKQDFQREETQVDAPETISACYQLDLAIASDKSMFTKYTSSVTNVQNHNIGVINNIQGDYTGEFSNDIQFNIVTQLVITGTDPWDPTLDPEILLDDFMAWGNAGGFGVQFDLGELWTNRDFLESTVGIAYLDVVCTDFRYHCLQDFTTSAQQLRCMTSHEIGHNFSCNHDPETGSSCPPNFIMCPFVSTTSTWSTASRNSVNGVSTFLINSGCLSPCGGGGGTPPVADFDWSPNSTCQNQAIQFTDMSTGSVTGRSWTFAGGTPGSSTQQNPSVIWANAGTFNVTLTVTGPGGPSSITQQVVIAPKPTANFTFTVNGNSVSFTNTSTNANTYLWNLGNGFTTTEVNPLFTYPTSGIYTVTLTATNSCGTSTKAFPVKTAPTALFTANPVNGCAPMTVQFTNQSVGSSITGYAWQFPGGNPATSTLPNPQVVYNTAGTYDVSLTTSNSSGSNTILKESLITVQSPPVAGFTWVISDLSVQFTNTSTNASSYTWDFGDGNSSTATNPNHIFASGGIQTVTLTASSICGTKTFIRSILLAQGPVPDFSANVTSGCGPLTVSFANQTNDNINSFVWLFPGGSPAISTATNPTVVYSVPGTYSVTLTVGNAAGTSTQTQQNYITVNGPPTPAFSSSVSGFAASFINTSVNAVSYSWNFGDGSNASTATNPSHSYNTDGTYTVTLTATNGCGASTSTQIVTIVTAPTAGFTANPSSGCAPHTVQFSNQSSSNATSFQWQFPGGSPATSTLPNPVVVYMTAGVFPVTLIAGNTAGSDTILQQNIISINNKPTAAFTGSSIGLTASFSNTSDNATSFLWNFGDGSNAGTATNPSHSYNTDGTYTVTLTATNGCGASTSTQIVTIVTAPTAGFTANPSSGCAPHTVQFSNQSSSNATSFQWQFPGGSPATSTLPNPVVVYMTPGAFTVTLIVGNTAGSDTILQQNIISINGKPTAAFNSSSIGLTASFSNISDNATSYTWNFGDGSAASSETNPSHSYAADGVYTVTLTANNICGSHVTTQTIVIVSVPTAGFSAGQTSGCGPLTVQFNNLSTSNATSLQWQFPGGSPAGSIVANPVVVYTTPGIYSVTLHAGNTAGSTTFSQTNYIVVLPLPTVGFTTTVDGATATFSNSSQNSQSFLWNFGDGNSSNNTSTEAQPAHTYSQDGNYTVTLTVSNNCGAASSSQIVTITTPPTALFNTDIAPVCANTPFVFLNASSANATSYAWVFEGGQPATATAAGPEITWSEPGVYTVTLTAFNGAGSNTTSATITIVGPPEAGFNAQTTGLSVVLDNTSVGANSYTWNFGEPDSGTADTSTLAAPVHQFGGVGTYNVVLLAENSCGADTFSTQVLIAGDAPLPAFSAGDLDVFCAPTVVHYTDLSAGEPNSWLWAFPGGDPATSTEQHPAVTYSQPGSYNATLTSGNIYGTNTAVVENAVLIGSAPTSLFEVSTNGSEVTLLNLSTGADSYLWQLGDGDTSNLEFPEHDYAQSGTYTIVLIASNDCGADTFALTTYLSITGTPDATAWNVFRLFPNPNTGQFTLEMSGIPQDQVEFVLFNTLGQQLILETADFSTGTLQYNFDVRYLPAAMYTLRVRAGSQSRFVKIALQR